MPAHTNRRRFVQLAGAGVALSVAGCNALQSDAGNTTNGPTGDGDSDATSAGSATVALRIQLGQQARQQLQRRQLRIQSRVQSGNISQSEARSQIQSAREQLYVEAIDSFESGVASESNITVEDSVEPFGLVLVSGSPAALVDSLSTDPVGAMYPESAFDRAKSRVQEGPQTPAGGTKTAAPTGTPTDDATTTVTEGPTATLTTESTGTSSE